MNPEQINRQKVALVIGNAIMDRLFVETERDQLAQEIAGLRGQVKPSQTDQPETGKETP